nr:unnamed protein product [Callosobruchus analis]
MDRNIDIDDFSKICRLCLACGNLQPFINLKLLDTFSKITSIQVTSEDKLPENVCKSCVRQLDRISKFIQTCSNNDKFLRDIINRSAEKDCFKQTESTDNDVKSESSDDDKIAENRDDQIFRDIKEEDEERDQTLTTFNLNKAGPVGCNFCCQIFSTRLELLDHYKENPNCKQEHDQNMVKYLDKSESDCKNEDDTEYNGKEPHLKGKKMFLCNFCGKNYTRKNGLDRHILSHTGVKPFECKECGKRYITKDTLKTHILTHTGIKAFKCQLCGKNFTQSSHLSYHMKRHQGERPFVCTYCGKCFVSNYHLERHKLMHTGVKPYQCKQCGKQVSANKSFEFLFEGEEPAIPPYKIYCNEYCECSDFECSEDKFDVSEVKIKADIDIVDQECKCEDEIIDSLTYGEQSREEMSCKKETKLPDMEVISSETQNVVHSSSCGFDEFTSCMCSKTSSQEKQGDEMSDILDHDSDRKEVAVGDDTEVSSTDDLDYQTEVKVGPSNCDVGQRNLGGENEVTGVLGSIFQKMPPDSASTVAMNDPLICDFALEYVESGNSEIIAMKKMRELAKLLIRVKMLDSSIDCLKDVLKHKHVAVIIYALKILGRYDEKSNKYEKGASVLSVGTSLKHCCRICVRKADLDDKKKFIGVLIILLKRLPRSISTNNAGEKGIRIGKQLPCGNRIIKTEPELDALCAQTTDNDDANLSGNNCAVGGNELTIIHEIKKEEEVVNIFEKVAHGSYNINSKLADDVILLENQMNSGYRKIKTRRARSSFCFICKKDLVNFMRHVRRHHSEVPEVKEILSIPVGDQRRKVLSTNLRKKWNFFGHRTHPRPVRHLNNKVNKRILPCANCLGFYTAKYLFRHRQTCGGATKGRWHQVQGQNLLIEHDVDPLLVETVFQRMTPDDISFTAKNDPLVCDFALKKLKTKKIGMIAISQRMRELAKLMIQMKTLDQSVKGLKDILKPKYFDNIISSLKIVAKFNEKVGKYQRGHVVKCIGSSLKICCEIVIADKRSEEIEEARDMLEILQIRWPKYDVLDYKRRIKIPSVNEKGQNLSKKNKKPRVIVRWTEEQKEAVKSFFAEKIKNKKNVNLRDCVNIKNRYPTLLANKDWTKIKSFVQYACRKTPQEETKRVAAAEKKLLERPEMLRRALQSTEGKVDIKKIYENVPEGTNIQEKEQLLRGQNFVTSEDLFAAKLHICISKEEQENTDNLLGITFSENSSDILFGENKPPGKNEIFSVDGNVQNVTNICYGEEVYESTEESYESKKDFIIQDTFSVTEQVEYDKPELVHYSNLVDHAETRHSQATELTDILSLPLESECNLSKVRFQRETKTNNASKANTKCPRPYSATQLIDTILRKMAPDDVTSTARNDSLIRTFALDYLKTHKLGNISIVSRKMRELAELLILSRNSQLSLVNLIDILKPINLCIIINTSKTMAKCGDELNRLGNSLLLSSIKESLIKCCEIIIKDGKFAPHVIYDCKALTDILKTQWPKFVPVNDTTQFAGRGESVLQLEKETLIPWTGEQRNVVKSYFAEHIKHKIEVGESECSDLKKLYPDLLANQNWENIQEFVQKAFKGKPEREDAINRECALSSGICEDRTYKVYLNTIKDDENYKKDADSVLDSCKHSEKLPGGDKAEDGSVLDETDFEMKQESVAKFPTRRLKHFCLFCKMEVSNFARHLQRHHSHKPELRQIMLLPQGSVKRKFLLTKLRKTWHYLSGKNRKHGRAKFKLLDPATGQNLLETSDVDPVLVENVFRRMRPDSLSFVARNDPLICKFALEYCKVYKSRCSISQKMRALAKLLLLVKNLEPTVSNLRDTLKPKHFDVIIRAIKKVGEFNEALDRFEEGTLVVRIGSSLRSCCKIIIESEELSSDEAGAFKTFLNMLRRDWPKLDPSTKEVKISKSHSYVVRTPWTEQQKKVVELYFADHRISFVNEAECTKLKKMYPDLLANKNWTKIKQAKISETYVPQLEDVQGEVSLAKEENNEVKEASTAENDRLEEDNGSVDAPKSDGSFMAEVSPVVEHTDNTTKEVSCFSKKKRRVLVPWTIEQKQIVKTFFADHIKRKQAVKQYECMNLKTQYPELLANKSWEKIKVYVQNLYTNKTK